MMKQALGGAEIKDIVLGGREIQSSGSHEGESGTETGDPSVNVAGINDMTGPKRKEK